LLQPKSGFFVSVSNHTSSQQKNIVFINILPIPKRYGSFAKRLEGAFDILFGLGLSLRGVRTCGDYMFSGNFISNT
jgi:hypothetical protein